MSESTAKEFLRKHPRLFWDERVMSTISAEYIINRILYYGHISDIKDCINLMWENKFKDQIRFHLSQKMIQCHPSNIRFLSLPIETEFGNYFDKEVYVHYLDKYNIPIEKTRTCVKKFDIQCWDCPPCYDRRLSIKRAWVIDKTEYLYEM